MMNRLLNVLLLAGLCVWLGNGHSVPADETAPISARVSPEPSESAAVAPHEMKSDEEASHADATGGVLLRYRFQPGQIVRYTTSDESVVDVEQGRESTTVKYSTQTWKHYRVKSIDESGAAVIEVVIDRVLMRAEGDGQSVTFDSRQPGPAPAEFHHLLDAIGKAAVALTVRPDGRLVRADDLTGRKASRVSLEDRDTQILAVLPSEPVNLGATWTERFDVPVKLEGKLTRNVKLQRTYRLTGLDEGTASIDLETVVITPIHDPEIESQLIQRTPSGMLTIDRVQGLVTSKRTTLHNEVVGFSGPGSKIAVARTYLEQIDAGDDALTARSATAENAAR